MQKPYKPIFQRSSSANIKAQLKSFLQENNLGPLTPPCFPTLATLVKEDLGREPKKERVKGLFETLINNPAVLFEDVVRNPDKYDESLLPLLQKLLSNGQGIETLSNEERSLLDLAVHDFLRKQPPPQPPQAQVKTASLEPEEFSSGEQPVDVDGLPPYWWV